MTTPKKDTLPDGWTLTTVGEVCEIRDNLRFPINRGSRKQMVGSYPYYGPTGILDYIDEFRVEAKHVLIGEDGDHFLKYADRPMTLLVDGQFNVNNHAHLLRGTDRCLTEWMFWFYHHADLFSVLTRQGAGRFKLTREALEKLPLRLPPMQEQQRIVATLGTWQTAIDQTTKVLPAKARLSSALLQELIATQSTPLARLADLVTVLSGGTPSRANPGYWGGAVPWFSAKDLKSFHLRRSEECLTQDGVSTFGKLVPPDTILVLVRGMTLFKDVPLGVTTLPSAFNQDVKALWVSDGTCPEYLAYCLLAAKRQLLGLVDSAGHGTGRLATDLLVSLEVPLPPLAEQRRIAAVLNTLDREIRLLRQYLDALKKQKKGLMQLLLTGKLRVRTE